jgi:hypothetical protein
MPSTDRKLELKAKTSVAQTGSQPYVYAKGFSKRDSNRQYQNSLLPNHALDNTDTGIAIIFIVLSKPSLCHI